MRASRLAAAAAVIAGFIAFYLVGGFSWLAGLLGYGGGGGEGYIVVDSLQSFARVTSEVPYTIELYLYVRVIDGPVSLCSLRIEDLHLRVPLHVAAQANSEGWLSVDGIVAAPTPITVQLLSRPSIGDHLSIVIEYCDGRTYNILVPLAS